MPPLERQGAWVELVNTARPGGKPVREATTLIAHSLALLRFEGA